jgi:hypothetical protein
MYPCCVSADDHLIQNRQRVNTFLDQKGLIFFLREHGTCDDLDDTLNFETHIVLQQINKHSHYKLVAKVFLRKKVELAFLPSFVLKFYSHSYFFFVGLHFHSFNFFVAISFYCAIQPFFPTRSPLQLLDEL